MSKRDSTGHIRLNTVTMHDLRTAQNFLASYDYSPATIGKHSCLVRCCDDEPFLKFSSHRSTVRDFISQLDEKERALSNKCHLDSERCAMITGLRQYLEQNGESFQQILKEIHRHLAQSMREDPPPSSPKSGLEFAQQYQQRKESVRKLRQAYRIGRLRFNHNKPSMNILNLQKWISTHFQLYVNMLPRSVNRPQALKNLDNLLNDSFFIIQHPSPPVATHSPRTNDGVTAKMNCRLICLLDRSNPHITIDHITPFVCQLPTGSQAEEPDICYQQEPIDWQTYSVITSSNNYQTFLRADLSKIRLQQPLTMTSDQTASAAKPRYAPMIYRIDFKIAITVRFSNDLLSHQTDVIVQSAPFGLVSNTSQDEDLFARVFLEDIKSESSPAPLTTELTVEKIVQAIESHFIHKTGIYPKGWVMPYIETVLQNACQTQAGSIESQCHSDLVKILAQIDCMAKHPLLSFFHDDGLFLGICDDDLVDQNLLYYQQFCQKSICAIRFGAMSRMSDLKEIGIRVILVDKGATQPQRWKFDTTKISMELGLYIIKIFLCQTASLDNLLINVSANATAYDQNVMTNLTQFVNLYYSEKLLSICPHEERYPSIWNHTYHEAEMHHPDHRPYNSNPSTIYQTESNIPSLPTIIVVNNPHNCILSKQDVNILINDQFPELSQLLQTPSIYHINTDPILNSASISTDDFLDSLDFRIDAN